MKGKGNERDHVCICVLEHVCKLLCACFYNDDEVDANIPGCHKCHPRCWCAEWM